jgi:hypothetical protein
MEDIYKQVSFALEVASKLDQWKQRGSYLYNFRCPFCGDSQKSKYKARGYLYRSPHDGLLHYKCHNCPESGSFRWFLSRLDESLLRKYRLETLSVGGAGSTNDLSILPVTQIDRQMSSVYATELLNLSRIHPARKYIAERKIPADRYECLYYTDDFSKTAESLGIPFDDIPSDARILLVETDKFGKIKLISGRRIDENSKTLRYITLRLDETYPKLFGYSSVKPFERVYVVEGAIDSLFVQNSIASLDANLTAYTQYVPEFRDTVYVFDNEPRNRQIVAGMKRVIDEGKQIVIFPGEIEEKDINQMVQANIDVNFILRNHIRKGITAKMEFNRWKRV